MAVMALAATEATAMERGPPMLMLRLSLLPRPSLRLMPTGAVMAMAVMALAMVVTDTARGPLMPMPTMAVMALAAMAVTAMVATDTARGPLMPMPTTPVMALAAMAVTAMVATDTARGPLMPMPTMAATAMVVMATAVAMDTARGPLMPTTAAATVWRLRLWRLRLRQVNQPQTSKSAIASLHQNCHLKISFITRRPGKLMAVCLSTINQTTNEEFRYIHTAL